MRHKVTYTELWQNTDTVLTNTLLRIDLQGQYYNHWPFARITVNDRELFDGQVQDSVSLMFNINADEKNLLRIKHHGKRFGDEGVYDCSADQTEDCVLTIKDIRFDDVTVGDELMSQLFFQTCWTDAQLQTIPEDQLAAMNQTSAKCGIMNFNSTLDIEFETPIFNWLTIAKYKKPVEKTTYFSNHALRWHYEEDLKLIEEIKQLIK